MRSRIHVAVAAVCALLAGCGTPGAPQPPSLQLPRPVNDVAATRVGNQVTLTWTPPFDTTDGVLVRHPGPTLICRAANVAVATQCQRVGEVPPNLQPPSGKTEKLEYADTLPAQDLSPNGFATYAVEVQNDRGRSAGLSNQVQVPLAPTVDAPSAPATRVSASAIEVSVGGARRNLPAGVDARLHVYRRTTQMPRVDLGVANVELQAGGGYTAIFEDRTFDWEQTYIYSAAWITTVPLPGRGAVEVMGASSPETSVSAHDVFAPAQPGGVQAVASGVGQAPFIDLTWAPNTDSDLAGYNVYRREEGQQPVKINDALVPAPAFRDSKVQKGHKYSYSVTAIDLRGNESKKSAEGSETLQ